MDEKFTPEEQKSVGSVLYNLVYADFRQRHGEVDCLKACFGELGLAFDGFVAIPRNELPTKSYETLKRMTAEKKHIFSRMMTEISRSDSHFGPRERAFVKEILDYCEVPFVHK